MAATAIRVWRSQRLPIDKMKEKIMAPIYQGILPAALLKELDRLNLPQRTLAELADFSESTLSSFLNGRRGLSPELQVNIFDVLRFCRELQKSNPLPIDFGNAAAIKRRYNEFCAAITEKTIIQNAADLQARAEST
jgi:hypothetical protein